MELQKIFVKIIFLPVIFCSIENRAFELRIIGGINAEPHSAPYIVSLFARNRRGLIPYCAGSLLNENWILTAAHCLILDAYRIYAVTGVHNITKFEDTVQRRRADFIIPHEDFDQIGPYDIGLIHVSEPFNFTSQVQPVKLSTDDDPIGIATVFGWGSLLKSRERKFPTTLMTVNLTLVTNEYCESRYPVEINEANICAGLPDGSKGACVGDSGGPLMQNDTQIGIISWGPQSCDPEEGPSVFTKITSYVDWIMDTMRYGLGGSDEYDDDEEDYNDDFNENDIVMDESILDNINNITKQNSS